MIAREIREQGRGRLARQAPVQVKAVVLHPVAIADFAKHLDILQCPLLQALRLKRLVLRVQLRHVLPQFLLNGLDGGGEPLLGRDVVAVGVNLHPVEFPQNDSAQRLDFRDGVDLVAEELDANRLLLFVGGENFDDVPARAKRGAAQSRVRAPVLNPHELGEQFLAIHFHADGNIDVQIEIIGRRAQPVDGTHARHHDDVIPHQCGARGRVAQAVQLVVDGGVFFDERIRGGDVGFGLIVVVIADEILHRVVREKPLELVVKLRGQGFVVGDDERGFPHLRDDVRHRERLAGTGDAQEDLVVLALFELAHDGVYRLGLIARGGEFRVQFEAAHEGSSASGSGARKNKR